MSDMTALEMSETEMRRRARALVSRQRTTVKSVSQDDREALLESARQWGAVVHARYGAAVRVFIFGSLVSSALWRGAASDVDLAVEGLSGSAYWDAWRLAEQLIPGRPVDLVDLEMATPSLRDAVRQTGIQI